MGDTIAYSTASGIGEEQVTSKADNVRQADDVHAFYESVQPHESNHQPGV